MAAAQEQLLAENVRSSWLFDPQNPVQPALRTIDELRNLVRVYNDFIYSPELSHENVNIARGQYALFFQRCEEIIRRPVFTPRFVFVGKPGIGKTTLIQTILRQTSTFADLRLIIAGGGTTSFRHEFKVVAGLSRVLIQVRPLETAQVRAISEIIARANADEIRNSFLPEELRAMKQRVARFARNVLGIDPELTVIETYNLMLERFRGNEDERRQFVQWMVGHQNLIELYCENANDIQTLLHNINILNCSMELPWPSSVSVELPAQQNLQTLVPFTLVDLPGIRERGHENDGVNRVMFDFDSITSCDIYLLCQEFTLDDPDPFICRFLETAFHNDNTIACRCCVLAMGHNDNFRIIDDDGRLLDENEALRVRLRLILENYGFSRERLHIPAILPGHVVNNIPGRDVVAVIDPLMILLNYWSVMMLYRYARIMQQYIVLALKTTHDEWFPQFQEQLRVWVGLPIPPPTKFFFKRGNPEAQTIRAMMNRCGVYNGNNLYFDYKESLIASLLQHVELLRQQLITHFGNNNRFNEFIIVAVWDLQSAVYTTRSDPSGLINKMLNDNRLWRDLQGFWGASRPRNIRYTDQIIDRLNDFMGNHTQLVNDDLRQRLNHVVENIVNPHPIPPPIGPPPPPPYELILPLLRLNLAD